MAMKRRIFVVDLDEPNEGWMNTWNLQLVLQRHASGGAPYEVYEITDQLSQDALEACLDDTNSKTTEVNMNTTSLTPFQKCEALLHELHLHMACDTILGRGDTAEADEIRDRMDKACDSLTQMEIGVLSELSADLYQRYGMA